MNDKILPIEQVVYVPSTNQKQRQISPQDMARRVSEVKKFLSDRYGGFTSVKGEGGYAMMKGKSEKIVQEGVVKVTSFSTRDKYKTNKTKLHNQLRTWGKKWGQESIGLEVEGDLRYVYPAISTKIPITVKEMKERHSPSWIEKETKGWK